MRRIFCSVALVLAVPALAADEKPEVRFLKGVRPAEAANPGPPVPVEIKSAAELEKSRALDAADRAAAKKAVNFDKEKLVLMAWSGSGGDRLAPELVTADKKLTAVFKYTAGFTDDLRRHAYAFAVPRDAAVEVKK